MPPRPIASRSPAPAPPNSHRSCRGMRPLLCRRSLERKPPRDQQHQCGGGVGDSRERGPAAFGQRLRHDQHLGYGRPPGRGRLEARLCVTVRTSLSRRPSDWLSAIRLSAAARRAARAAPMVTDRQCLACARIDPSLRRGDGEPRRRSGFRPAFMAGFRRGEAARLF
jgi:hypothetical protein